MIKEPNLDRAERMFGRILDDLDGSLAPGPWLSGARTLSERLVISDNAFYYLVEKLTECLVRNASENDPELQRIGDELDAVARAHGLKDHEYWRVDEGPDEWQALNAEWERRGDDIVATTLRELGHADVADALQTNRRAFNERAARGQSDIWGEEDAD